MNPQGEFSQHLDQLRKERRKNQYMSEWMVQQNHKRDKDREKLDKAKVRMVELTVLGVVLGFVIGRLL